MRGEWLVWPRCRRQYKWQVNPKGIPTPDPKPISVPTCKRGTRRRDVQEPRGEPWGRKRKKVCE